MFPLQAIKENEQTTCKIIKLDYTKIENAQLKGNVGKIFKECLQK